MSDASPRGLALVSIVLAAAALAASLASCGSDDDATGEAQSGDTTRTAPPRRAFDDRIGDCEVKPRTGCQGAKLIQAQLSGAELAGAKLDGAELAGADLSHADLAGASLNEIYGLRLNLKGANLEGANMLGADLRRANLSETNLRQANLSGADIAGADLRGAMIDGSTRACSTRLPGGLRNTDCSLRDAVERASQP
jgi:hypothetical protein